MIYFIAEAGTDYVKIGYTDSYINRRLAALQTGNPRTLEVLFYFKQGTYNDEQHFHGLYSNYRVSGEWFNIGDMVRKPGVKKNISAYLDKRRKQEVEDEKAQKAKKLEDEKKWIEGLKEIDEKEELNSKLNK